MEKNLQILHLSDLHLAGSDNSPYPRLLDKYWSVYNNDALKTLAETVYRWRDRLDAILISGDIAVSGTESNLERVIEFFDSPAHSLPGKEEWLNSKQEPTLRTFPGPIIIVPGNHDRYSNLLGWPGKLFYNYFSSYWKVGAGGIQHHILPNEETPILAVICADFSLDSIFHSTESGGHWGQGKVYEERLRNLIKSTEEVTKLYPACAIIWMIHFAPKCEDHFNSTEKIKLIDSEKLIEEAEKAGVRYIFCGHTHLSKEYQPRKSDIWINCAGTSTCTGSDIDTTIHLRNVKIENGRVIEIRSRTLTYDPERQIFA